MKVGILGRGFGLYGWMPAVLNTLLDAEVFVPARYVITIRSRYDLAGYSDRIRSCATDDAVLDECEMIILALTPLKQFEYAQVCFEKSNITHMILEKPLGSTPEMGSVLLSQLRHSGKKFLIDYLFRYTQWGEDLLINPAGFEGISWYFQNPNHAGSWKLDSDPVKGGGPLKFYGIHLLALCAELGYQKALYSFESRTNWTCKLVGSLPDCQLKLATESSPARFKILQNGKEIWLKEPFADFGSSDRRIPALQETLKDFLRPDFETPHWYEKVNDLWVQATGA